MSNELRPPWDQRLVEWMQRSPGNKRDGPVRRGEVARWVSLLVTTAIGSAVLGRFLWLPVGIAAGGVIELGVRYARTRSRAPKESEIGIK